MLGLFEPGEWLERKGVVWSNNPVGNALAEILEALVKVGVLERREEPDVGFRWVDVAVDGLAAWPSNSHPTPSG